jgi:hypothetical protein
LLTEEYALRFGATYPGGIFWLRAHGDEATAGPTAAAAEAVRLEQFGAIAIALGIQDLDPGRVRAQLLTRLLQQGQPGRPAAPRCQSPRTRDCVWSPGPELMTGAHGNLAGAVRRAVVAAPQRATSKSHLSHVWRFSEGWCVTQSATGQQHRDHAASEHMRPESCDALPKAQISPPRQPHRSEHN